MQRNCIDAPDIWYLKILYAKKPSNELQKGQNYVICYKTVRKEMNTLFQINIVVQNTAK